MVQVRNPECPVLIVVSELGFPLFRLPWADPQMGSNVGTALEPSPAVP
jgi:hypothetical protein